jgi:hypothetical protein
MGNDPAYRRSHNRGTWHLGKEDAARTLAVIAYEI